MKFFIKLFLQWVLFIFLVGCSDIKEIKGLNKKEIREWRWDKNGCQEKRKKIIKKIHALQSFWIGASAENIIEVLGMPDKIELHSKNQRFLIYYFTTGKQCKKEKNYYGNSVSFKFNALQELSELIFQFNTLEKVL